MVSHTTEVAEGIYRLTNGVANFYLIAESGKLVLVDAGAPKDWVLFSQVVRGLGQDAGDLDAVLLTHAHTDHTGFAERARTTTGALVWIHEHDAQVARTGRAGLLLGPRRSTDRRGRRCDPARPGRRTFVKHVTQEVPLFTDTNQKGRITMTRMTSLLERNEQFARTYASIPLAPPATQMVIVTCSDHRLDPAMALGLQLGDALVIRNAGGRVTQAVIGDVAYLAFLAEQLFPDQVGAEGLFEVAVIHHTQCGTGFLADRSFRQKAAEATGVPEATLEASAVDDPHTTVQADVERLLNSPLLSPKVSVSGHVYDIATGRLTTTIDARYP